MESSETNPGGRTGFGRWIARILAVLAVAGAALAVYLVIAGSSDSGEKGDGKRSNREQPKEQPQKPPEKPPETYVVQPGDTLDGIAEQVGMQVERIEQLNPEIDPQALPSGETLKLR